MTTIAYPLRFTPVYKDYIWGGNRIAERYHRQVPYPVCAESWEISDHPDGMSIISNGPLAGLTLGKLVSEHRLALLGDASSGSGPFPLLIKVIDAKQNLSLQVHPDNASAPLCGGEPKTEMWVWLDAVNKAGVYLGLKPGTTEVRFLDALRAKQLPELFQWFPGTPGDAVFVPGGCLHAIGAGALLLEIQQNSNTTYRVYDWDRVGPDGQPRAIHLDKALKVIHWDAAPKTPLPKAPPVFAGNNRHQPIHTCPYFQVSRWDLKEPQELNTRRRSFAALFVTTGSARVSCGANTETLPTGASCLIPAATEHYTVRPLDGPASLILTELP